MAQGNGDLRGNLIPHVEFGRRVRAIRLERRLTLKQLETACGLSATHISEIERGRTSPTIGALIRLSRSLGCEPAYLMEPEERPEVSASTSESRKTDPIAHGVSAERLSSGIPGTRIHPWRLRFHTGAERPFQIEAREGATAAYHVISGELEIAMGPRKLILSARESVHISLTSSHALRPVSEEGAETIAIFTDPLLNHD